MKLFVFTLIYLIGIILSSISNTQFFHFGIWYSVVFGAGWFFLLITAYHYTKKKILPPINVVVRFRPPDEIMVNENKTPNKKPFIKK